ncbi:MAG: hypothetical protein ABIG61_17810 [Planctomycetota bacterium]
MRKPFRPFIPDVSVFKIRPYGLPHNRVGALTDSSTKGHNAAIYGPLLNLDGTADYLSVITPWDWMHATTRQYAVFAAHIYHNATAAEALYYEQFSTTADKFDISIDVGDFLDVKVRGVTGDTQRTFNSLGSDTPWLIDPVIWHSLIVQIDATSSTVDTWLDGVRKDTAAALSVQDLTAFAAGDTPALQYWGESGGAEWDGSMRSMGLLSTSTSITNAQAAFYHAQSAQLLSDLAFVGQWHCNEGVGGVIIDRSGNGHPLALTGTTWVTTRVFGNFGVFGSDTL